ncbi:MAG: polysaccharide biosynthesis tyrosine autokinase [Candidatus Latescibacterota bacterium]|nr:MAG: polysaccharide biosynthesis tyrosine autokinase [Candidatus Latescibacterota bacterium]
MSKIYEALHRAGREREEGRRPEDEIPLKEQARGRLSVQLRAVWSRYEALHSSLGKTLGGITGKAIVFASSVEGEGTTTVIAEYAASLGGTKDRAALLVDANFRAPRLHEFFGVPNEKGLADVLLGTADLASAAIPIGEEQLHLLPTGVTTTTPGALLTFTRLTRFLAEAKQRYALVLIDAPPIISYTETTILASVADGLALVVESERTKREIVKRARDTIEETKGNILGVVLNRRRYVIPEFLYRYL